MQLKFLKTRNVKSPTRGTEQSAGVDFYIPTDIFHSELASLQPTPAGVQCVVSGHSGLITQMTLPPQSRVNIPSGIKVKFPKGKCGLFVEKSGVSSKTGLNILAKLIDEDYQGEVFLNVVNNSSVPVKLFPGDKLVQMIIIDSNIAELVEVDTPELLFGDVVTSRGTGGFGSTDKKAVKLTEDATPVAPAEKEAVSLNDVTPAPAEKKTKKSTKKATKKAEVKPVDPVEEDPEIAAEVAAAMARVVEQEALAKEKTKARLK